MTFFEGYAELRRELGSGAAERALDRATVHVKRSAFTLGFLFGVLTSALLVAAIHFLERL